MSSPSPDDFFPLGPEHENPEEPGDFFPLTPETENLGQLGNPALQGGYLPQWQAAMRVTKPNGEVSSQNIRVAREEGDTEMDIRIKLAMHASEIQQIIAERGGDYDVTIDITSIEAI